MKNQNSIRNLANVSGVCALLLFAGPALAGLIPDCANFPSEGGSAEVEVNLPLVTLPAFPSWPVSLNPFIHIASVTPVPTVYPPINRVYKVCYTVDPNPGCQRAGSLLIEGVIFPIKQAAYLPPLTGLSPDKQTLSFYRVAVRLTWSPPPCASDTTFYRLAVYSRPCGQIAWTPVEDIYTASTSHTLPVIWGHDYSWGVQAADCVTNGSDQDVFWASTSSWASFRYWRSR